ncbi:hypothetical protein [Serpentinicella alkaliphila]|uniref:Uncharacterized protein n=1 Tax=Serpentinicella alkaliphila TaxID=1734049 RepID=A0A4R2SX21_9FIRM|nr:hypothetical protein [Serpentinicella alkaliphila]QUH27147.1 hypothetical protein HZR23_16410 [Serpentinicella alkaliphila]TCP95037.1 hypothetical protein EDD79_10651 [Serpentinicella alkaliphila]
MDEKILNEAVESVELIKSIISRTKESFISFSTIFIYWGLLFTLNSIIMLYMTVNKEKVGYILNNYPILNFMAPVSIIALVAALVYRKVSNKIPLVGLEKQLMKVWVLILAINVIPSKFSIVTGTSELNLEMITIRANSFSTMFFSLAMGLLITSWFTGYRQLKYLSCAYIGISALYAYFNIPLLSDSTTQILYSIAFPFTFFYTGFFLKSQQVR